MATTRRNAFDLESYRAKNPWELVNVMSVNTLCGRFPTRADAVSAAEYGGEVVRVDESCRRVYFARATYC